MPAKDTQDKGARKIAERTRFLNVIYFVDSNRTHTFKLSLKSAVICFTVLLCMIVWSILGSYFLVQSAIDSNQKSERIRGLLSTIFSYQSRYDEVYERSYPERSNQVSDILSSVEPKDSDSQEEDQSTEASKKSETTKPVQLAAKSVSKNSKPETTEAAEKTSQPPINIEKIETSEDNEKLTFSFALKNMQSPELSSGYVIGLASYKLKSGGTQTISSPADVDINEKIAIYSLSKNHRFSIRYYKKKVLQFEKPTDSEGFFQNIKIIIGDREGNRKEIVYNLKTEEIASTRSVAEPQTQ